MCQRYVLQLECSQIKVTQGEAPYASQNRHKSTVDIANNWSIGGRTRHVDV
jgi:hypothetical protein